MRRPKILWVALGAFSVLFCVFLGFWLWAEFGFERTVVIYEVAAPPTVEAAAPRAATVEETGTEKAIPAPMPEAPAWLMPARWATMAAAVVAAAYFVYLEAAHRRRLREQTVRTQE